MMLLMIDGDFLLPMRLKKINVFEQWISHPLKTEAATVKQMEKKKHAQHFTGPLF